MLTVSKFAIFVWETTGILVGKLLPDDDKELGSIVPPKGQKVIIADTIPTARGQGCLNDDDCRRYIATYGYPLHDTYSDNCALIDERGNVIDVHKADHLNITPEQLGYPAGYRYIPEATGTVRPGDIYADGQFMVRWVEVTEKSGVVSSVQQHPLGKEPASSAGCVCMLDFAANIGDKAALPKRS